MTSAKEAEANTFDQIWVTVSSPALRGDWLPKLADACPGATWISFSPGVEDRDYVAQYVPEDRLITGLIPFIAYQAPLPGETRFREPGIAFWHPPFSKTPFTPGQGSEAALQEACAALEAGGCRTTVQKAVEVTAQFPSAHMMPHLVALELADWSFAELRKSDWLKVANKASGEASNACCQASWRQGSRMDQAQSDPAPSR